MSEYLCWWGSSSPLFSIFRPRMSLSSAAGVLAVLSLSLLENVGEVGTRTHTHTLSVVSYEHPKHLLTSLQFSIRFLFCLHPPFLRLLLLVPVVAMKSSVHYFLQFHQHLRQTLPPHTLRAGGLHGTGPCVEGSGHLSAAKQVGFVCPEFRASEPRGLQLNSSPLDPFRSIGKGEAPT